MNHSIRLMSGVLLALSLGVAQAASITVRDISGRTVSVPQNPQRVILGEGRELMATAILDREDPFKRVVSWTNDLIKNGPDIYNAYKAKFPQSSAKVRNLGEANSLSAEQIIADRPDLVIFTETFHKNLQEQGILGRLDSAKIPYIFIDFREDFLKNTIPSMELLGKVFGQEKRARDYINFYNKNMNIVRIRVARTRTRPLVFVDRAAGYQPDQCCKTFGPHNFGQYVEIAGGRNWGSSFTDKLAVDVSLEAVIQANPDVIIATAANWANSISVPLGYGAQQGPVDARMRGLTQRTGFSDLRAVKNKQFYAIYHQFYTSPYSVFAIQQIAKWLHPEEFRDVNPEANFAQMHRRFLPIDYSGAFWTQLK